MRFDWREPTGSREIYSALFGPFAAPASSTTNHITGKIMNPNKVGTVRLPLDGELRTAVDAARKPRRLSTTGYVREAVIRDLVAQGLLQGGAR